MHTYVHTVHIYVFYTVLVGVGLFSFTLDSSTTFKIDFHWVFFNSKIIIIFNMYTTNLNDIAHFRMS